jgi:hypothetical protein
MKKTSVLLAIVASLIGGGVARADNAVVTSVTGNAQVQIGGAAPRALRMGDTLQQGATVSTGSAASLVLKFDDGQIAALTANSRMTITAYQYNPATESGNMLLSLVTGGMRAITGLIGRRTPNQVAYRAATATIGIRGTDGTIATNGTDVVVTVVDGVMTLTQGNLVLTIAAGEAVFTRPGQAPIRGPIATVVSQLPPAFQAAVAQSGALTGSVNAAGPGTPRQGGDQGPQGQQGGQSGQQGGPQGGGGAGGGGGGNQSGS